MLLSTRPSPKKACGRNVLFLGIILNLFPLGKSATSSSLSCSNFTSAFATLAYQVSLCPLSSDSVYFLDQNLWEMIIFDINFLKAFFGEEYNEELIDCPNGCTNLFNNWEFYSRQMILEKDYLKYLARFLDE